MEATVPTCCKLCQHQLLRRELCWVLCPFTLLCTPAHPGCATETKSTLPGHPTPWHWGEAPSPGHPGATEQGGMGKALRSSMRRGRRRQPSGTQRMAGGHRQRQGPPEDGGTVPGWVPGRRGPASGSEEEEKGEEKG